ncbi:MAG: OsmC family protein [Chloroflexaceae bacterium]|nr:OsmC family protein [Chloroflexaceae bacterium]
MADILRYATGRWSGDLKMGRGSVSTGSGVVEHAPVTFPSRFENGTGSNPEELIAAAHASCLSMALAHGLSQEGHTPQSITTRSTIALRKNETGFKITRIHLQVEGIVPGIDEAGFSQAAEAAKENCPVSVLLKPGLESLTLEARLSREAGG